MPHYSVTTQKPAKAHSTASTFEKKNPKAEFKGPVIKIYDATGKWKRDHPTTGAICLQQPSSKSAKVLRYHNKHKYIGSAVKENFSTCAFLVFNK